MMAEAVQLNAAAERYKRWKETERGSTEIHKGEFRAHLQFRDGDGKNIHICGPTRHTAETILNITPGSEG